MKIRTALVAGVLALSVTACGSDAEDASKKAGDAASDAKDKAGKAADDASKKAGEAADKAGKKADDAKGKGDKADENGQAGESGKAGENGSDGAGENGSGDSAEGGQGGGAGKIDRAPARKAYLANKEAFDAAAGKLTQKTGPELRVATVNVCVAQEAGKKADEISSKAAQWFGVDATKAAGLVKLADEQVCSKA